MPALALVAIDLCPGCGLPGHASETDDDGYHPGCRPASTTQRPVAMPIARDLEFSRATTQPLRFCADESARVWIDLTRGRP